MKRIRFVIAAISAGALVATNAQAHEPHQCDGLPDQPALSGHVDQADIVDGTLRLKEIRKAGRQLFLAIFNTCDGQGRPATTGTGDPRDPDQPAFIRTSAPDASSCVDCHVEPRAGGAGGFVKNVFVLAQALDPVTDSVSPVFSDERNTLGMFGSGAIDMLAREMTADLQAQAAALPDGTYTLSTKGVDFEIEKNAAGDIVASEGVDSDLIIKPFHQSGVALSIREFTVNAMNHHHGMQAEERFDLNPDKGFDPDFDRDGVERELTIGDITAVTIFQAALGTPGRVLPETQAEHDMVERGEEWFENVGCAQCHIPEMRLDSPFYVEPYELNPPGTFSDTGQSFRFDLTKKGGRPRLERAPGGGAIVRAYTDLKRHDLCDDPDDPDPIRFFCNEQLAQGRPDQDGLPGEEFFLTRKLWDVGNSAPYGHRGDLTTIAEAILMHGGEARASRDAFVAISDRTRADIVLFLKTLQVE